MSTMDAIERQDATTVTSTPRPTMPPVAADNIPADLRALPQWVAWQYHQTERGDWTKRPCRVANPAMGASSTDPATWSTFEAALALHQRQPARFGVGFVFADGGGMVGIDLDKCRDPESGELTDAAEAIIAASGTYCEVSPSQTGVKIFGRGELPAPGRQVNGQPDAWGGLLGKYEVYRAARFFTVTGSKLPEAPGEVGDAQAAIDWVWEIIETSGRTKRAAQSAATVATREITGGADVPARGDVPDDETILARARGARNGAKFSALWSGDTSGHGGDDSAADLALCSILAFWTGPDAARIDQLFRRSGLFREKWDERRGERTYGERTIAAAIELGEFHEVKSSAAEGYGEQRERKRRKKTATVAAEFANTEAAGDDERPLPMAKLLETLGEKADNWPRRVGSALFVDDKHGISWLESSSAFFGWLQRRLGLVRWGESRGCVQRAELFAELRRTATSYLAIEALPHEPSIEGHYYACLAPALGDGSHLRQLVERFAPATDIDGDLIHALFATPLWGGAGGSRPAFIITADQGRGVGKSSLAEMVGRLYGGHLAFSAGEDAGSIATRLLSPEGLTRRVVLIDNIKSLRFSWAELEAMVTASTISGRRLYVGEAQRPNTLTWILTLNGASLCTDIAQRSVIVKLDPPRRSGTWRDETEQFIDQHREQILGDIVAWMRHTAPELRQPSRWAAWERAILSRLPEPTDAQRVILDRQGAADAEMEEATIIEQHISERLTYFGMRPQCSKVFIPTGIMASFVNRATGERYSTVAVSRKLNQLHTEGRLKRLDPTRSYDRGWLWIGADVEADTKVSLGLKDKIESLGLSG